MNDIKESKEVIPEMEAMITQTEGQQNISRDVSRDTGKGRREADVLSGEGRMIGKELEKELSESA